MTRAHRDTAPGRSPGADLVHVPTYLRISPPEPLEWLFSSNSRKYPFLIETEIVLFQSTTLYNQILVNVVCMVKAVVFLVVMHRCESWTIKKAEH